MAHGPNRTVVERTCQQCGRRFSRVLAYLTYRRKHGLGDRLFCGLKCFGLSRRTHKSKAQRVADKAEYDRLYRERNREMLKAKRHAYFKRTYDPAKAAKERQHKMAWHVEYCRRYYSDPANKAHKVAYDAARRSAKYGDYAEAHLVALELKKELLRRCPDRYERMKARGYYTRPGAQKRRRDAQVSRW